MSTGREGPPRGDPLMSGVEGVLRRATAELTGHSPSARLDAELLLADLLGWSRLDLVRQSQDVLAPTVESAFAARVKRRVAGEPVAYIIGRKEFYGLQFQVSPAVLVPRPETEELVAWVVQSAAQKASAQSLRILDLGTGSGCIAISLAVELGARAERIVAVDISNDALAVARANADRLGVGAQIEFRRGDLFSEVAGETFDYIVTNPPYIAEGDPEIGPELRYEPSTALFSGADGLTVIRRIAEQYQSFLNPHGVLAVEFGASQGAALRKIFGPGATIVRDLSGRDRFALVAAA